MTDRGGRGFLIAFEGGEGCGKTTQSRLLAQAIGAVPTREPGGTAVGVKLRALLLDPSTGVLDPRAEALLVAADRAQHVAQVIEPALAAGRHVVTDRFVGSSLAYQGHGRGLAVEEVRQLSHWASGGLEPDLAVLLDVAPAVAATRRTEAPDRLEQEDDIFHRAVEEGYRTEAAADPDRWVVVDGGRLAHEVAADVAAAVHERLGLEVAP